MKRSLFILSLCAGLLILAIAGRIVWLTYTPGSDIHKPLGYQLIADLFLTHHWLLIDQRQTEITLDAAQEKTSVGGIFRRSFLASDVNAFNGGEHSAFRIENQQILSADTTRHNIVLPYGKVDRWEGALRYRPSATIEASLRGVGIDLELTGLTRPLLQHKAPDVTVRGDRKPLPIVTGRDEVINIYGQPGTYLGKVYLVGENVVVNNRGSSPASVTISVSGDRVPPGNRAWLAPGDLLKLEWRPTTLSRSRYALLWSEGGRSADVISTPCAINGTWSRCPEEPMWPFADSVISTLDTAMPGRRPSVRDDLDVVLSLDRELHRKTQDALERNRLPAVNSKASARRRNARAAVTVMNALSGEILALASFPTAESLSRSSLPATAERRLLRNHNFTRLPVGSVAKVLFSAAILDADPRLSSLRLRQHSTAGGVDTVAGIYVHPPVESHPVATAPDGMVDFHNFIEYSSNEYAAVLLTLACATASNEPLPTFSGTPLSFEGRYTITGQQYDRAPSPLVPNETRLKLQRDAKGRVVAGTQSTLEGEPWAESFHRLFGVEKIITTPIDARSPALGDGVVDTAVWQPVLTELYGSDVPKTQPFRAVGFERENLGLNLSHVYRTDLLSLMYGGAAARFTNPKLTEMFSRLVTGQKIERSLVLGVARSESDPVPITHTFAPLGLDDHVRDELLTAMTGVAVRHPNGTGGTAKALYGTLAAIDAALARRHMALGFFSKTGSPRNTITVPNGLAKAVNALIASRAVVLTPDDQLAYRGVVVTDDPEQGGDSASLQAIESNQDDGRLFEQYGVAPDLVHSALLLYNVETPENRARVFETSGTRIISMHAVRTIDTTGAVYVFTMGIYPEQARRSNQPLDIDAVHHEPIRALSVAINIEGHGKSTDVAVPFAQTLITDVLWPFLERQP